MQYKPCGLPGVVFCRSCLHTACLAHGLHEAEWLMHRHQHQHPARHARRGLAAAWHLQHVEVTNQTTGERASFYADTWLDAKAGTSTLLLEPATGPGAAAGSKNRYKVSVQTADKRGAGTDADVSVVLMGEGGKASQELRLESGANNFERNKVWARLQCMVLRQMQAH